MPLNDSSNCGNMSTFMFNKPSVLDQLVKLAPMHWSPNSASYLFLQNLIDLVDDKNLAYYFWIFMPLLTSS